MNIISYFFFWVEKHVYGQSPSYTFEEWQADVAARKACEPQWRREE
jgi:hypothetical protein